MFARFKPFVYSEMTKPLILFPYKGLFRMRFIVSEL